MATFYKIQSLTLICGLALAAQAHAWGPDGHHLVGAVADKLIAGTHAEQEVGAILGTLPLRDAAVWADCANNLPQSVLLSFVCAAPPETEQQAICRTLGDASAQIDQLTAEAVLSIELLRERRAALISAAVTGQIDVRGLAAEKEAA